MSASSPITLVLSPSNLLLLHIYCSLRRSHFSFSMAGEADQNPPVTTEPTTTSNKSDSRMESNSPATSSSATLATIKMADNQIPEITDFWKISNISKANRQAYHNLGWLTGNLISSIPKIDIPTTHGLIVVCYESHLVAGLGLHPSKFLLLYEPSWVRTGALQSECHLCP
jgi:hypothetical protein